MKEKDIQSEFGSKNSILGAFELKLCKGTSIRWDSVRENQIRALSDIKHSGLYHKLADSPVSVMADADSGKKRMRFTRTKPFDCFNLSGIPAYVVICWYRPRKLKELHYIDIDEYVRNMKNATRKSFRFPESGYMATHIVDFLKRG